MKKLGFLIILGLIIFTTISVIFVNKSSENINFLNASSIEALCEELTSTKTPNGVNLYNYVNDFKSKQKKYESTNWVTPSMISKGDYFQNSNILEKSGNRFVTANIEGDDNITKIVPKELFTYVNQKLYIGNEYGFYINTFQRPGKTYLQSTVILIDVTKSNMDDYAYDFKIQPLVQIDYCYANGNGQYIQLKNYENEDYNSANNCYINFSSGINNAVIPMIRNDQYFENNSTVYYMQYKESKDFSLSDISFASSVYNCNSLNYGDAGYNVRNDNGYFFNGNTYEYSATQKQSNGKVEVNVKQIATTLLDAAIGLIDIKEISQVYSFASAIIDVVNSVHPVSSEIIYNTTNQNYYCPEAILPPTKQGQIDQYGNLIKYSQMLINSDENIKLLFESGDYAKGTFKLSHTDKPNGAKEYSGLNVNVALKVINNLNGNIECFTGNTNVFTINEPETKNIGLLETYNCYLLPNSCQKFLFSPVYTSDYIFSLNLNTSAKIKINGVVYLGTNPSVRLIAGTHNTLEIFENESMAFGSIIILPNTVSKTNDGYLPLERIKLNANGGDYLLKIPDLTGINILKTNYTNVKIENIFTFENGNFLPYRPYFGHYNFTETSALSFPFGQQDNYYVLLRNNSSVNYLDAAFSVSEPTQINLGQAALLALDENYSFIKLITDSNDTGQYTMSINNAGSEIFDYIVYDKNFNRVLNPGYQTSNGIYILSLNADNVYYIGISNGSVSDNAQVIINKNENAYKWKIVGGPEGTQIVTSNIGLPQGYKYEIYFYINEIENPAQLIQTGGEGNYYGGYGLILSNNLLSVPRNAPIGGDGITITAMYNDYLGYLQTLRVTPLFVGTINFSITNSENLILNYNNVPANVTKFTYKIDPGLNEYTVNVSGTYGTHNLLNNLITSGNYSSLKNITVTLQVIYVIDASGKEVACTPTTTSSILFVNLFDGGTGTENNPLIINCARHLKNIIPSSGYYYKLSNNININDNWTPINNFNGTLDGNNYRIYNFVMNVGTGSGNYGLVGINNGTIKNLNIVCGGVTVSSNSNSKVVIGIFAGINNGTIDNCSTVKTAAYGGAVLRCDRDNSEIGGIAGLNCGSIAYCQNNLTLYGSGDMGGITGKTVNVVRYCTNNGDIYYTYSIENRSIGGIVGIQCETASHTYSCTNNGYIGFQNTNVKNNPAVKPCIAQIIGYKQAGFCGSEKYIYSGHNTLNGSVYIAGLSGSQTEYAGNREVGRG